MNVFMLSRSQVNFFGNYCKISGGDVASKATSIEKSKFSIRFSNEAVNLAYLIISLGMQRKMKHYAECILENIMMF